MQSVRSRRVGTGPVRYVAAALAIAAGLIHFGVMPEHFEEALEYGVFMLVVGVAQVAAGVLLLIRPSRALIIATMLGTVVVFAIYAASRTTGLPFGPMPLQAEHVHTIDIISKITELAFFVLLVWLVARWSFRRVDSTEPNANGQV